MHEKLVDELLSFTRENNLKLDCIFNEDSRIYRFGFHSIEHNWSYYHTITGEQLDLFKGDTIQFAYQIINIVKARMPS